MITDLLLTLLQQKTEDNLLDLLTPGLPPAVPQSFTMHAAP